MFEKISQQFTSDPKARIHKEVSNVRETVGTLKKNRELKVLDSKTAQNLSNHFIYLIFDIHGFLFYQ